jgi:hypothetical protein
MRRAAMYYLPIDLSSQCGMRLAFLLIVRAIVGAAINRGGEIVKFKKSAIAAAIVGGALGLAANFVGAKENIHSRRGLPTDRYPVTIGDDSSLAPGVPGVTEENTSDMTADEVRKVQQALAAEGYDPGRSDGAMTNDTRAAIREFQKDNGIVMTGGLDAKTAMRLGIEFSRSSG